jgi:hypothetical protein
MIQLLEILTLKRAKWNQTFSHLPSNPLISISQPQPPQPPQPEQKEPQPEQKEPRPVVFTRASSFNSRLTQRNRQQVIGTRQRRDATEEYRFDDDDIPNLQHSDPFFSEKYRNESDDEFDDFEFEFEENNSEEEEEEEEDDDEVEEELLKRPRASAMIQSIQTVQNVQTIQAIQCMILVFFVG